MTRSRRPLIVAAATLLLIALSNTKVPAGATGPVLSAGQWAAVQNSNRLLRGDGSVVFVDDFESGDLNAWDAVQSVTAATHQ